MSMKAKRHEEPKNSVAKTIGRGIGYLFALIKSAIVVASIIAMPVLFAWMMYLVFTLAPIVDVARVCLVLAMCLVLNLFIDPR